MSNWTFITNPGIVFLFISRQNRITAREIPKEIGSTERSVLRIIADPVKGGYIQRMREGRRNRYTIRPYLTLQHGATKQSVVDLLAARNSRIG